MTKPNEASRKTKLTPEQTIEFQACSRAESWWRSDGIYIDPDTEDVDWYDKRGDLARIAFIAGYKQARLDASRHAASVSAEKEKT